MSGKQEKSSVRKRRVGAKMGPKDKLMDTSTAKMNQELSRPLLGSSEEEEEVFEMQKMTAEDDIITKVEDPEEAAWQIAVQVFLPYLVAGIGMVAAGMVLDEVQVSKNTHTIIL